jgi:hypothetical protein
LAVGRAGIPGIAGNLRRFWIFLLVLHMLLPAMPWHGMLNAVRVGLLLTPPFAMSCCTLCRVLDVRSASGKLRHGLHVAA